jgi:hypothetical protein
MALGNPKTATTCRGCAHFFVTYDPLFPYGCRRMGFKSRRYPHIDVQNATGESCQGREERERPEADIEPE